MKKREDNVLAEGEATGHFHRAHGDGVAVYGDGDNRELEAPNGATVTHEEHGTQVLPAGDWDVSRVQEFDPFEEEVRSVQD